MLNTIGSDGSIATYDLQRADTTIPPLPKDVPAQSPRRQKTVVPHQPVQYEEAQPFQPTPAEPSMVPVAASATHALGSMHSGSEEGMDTDRSHGSSTRDLSRHLGGVREFNGVLLGGARSADDEV